MQVAEVIEKLFSEMKVIKSAGRDTPYGKSSYRENFEKYCYKEFYRMTITTCTLSVMGVCHARKRDRKEAGFGSEKAWRHLSEVGCPRLLWHARPIGFYARTEVWLSGSQGTRGETTSASAIKT